MGIEPGLLSLLTLGIMLVLLLIGMPVAFVLLFLSVVGFLVIRGPDSLAALSIGAFTTITKDTLVCLPTFIFMATVLEVSGLGGVLYDMMHKWMAGLRGGLAMGTVAISTLIGAMSGSCATATLTMGLLAYPEMAKRHYDRKISIGCCLLYTSPSPRDQRGSRMPSSA